VTAGERALEEADPDPDPFLLLLLPLPLFVRLEFESRLLEDDFAGRE
jgi:hypothetical protein